MTHDLAVTPPVNAIDGAEVFVSLAWCPTPLDTVYLDIEIQLSRAP